MKRRLILALVTICASTLRADDKALEKYAKNLLQGKAFIVRNFYTNSKLEYDENGILIGQPKLDCWAHGRVLIDKANLKKGSLDLRAHHLASTYDSKNLTFTDFGETDEVRINIKFAEPNLDENKLNHALNQVFLTSADNLADLMPVQGPSISLHSKPGDPSIAPGMVPPVAVFVPDPEPTPEALQKKTGGIVLLWLTVGTDGCTYDQKVARSLGMGLDESALAAVSQWRFKPATRDGKPVPVGVKIEVNFHIH